MIAVLGVHTSVLDWYDDFASGAGFVLCYQYLIASVVLFPHYVYLQDLCMNFHIYFCCNCCISCPAFAKSPLLMAVIGIASFSHMPLPRLYSNEFIILLFFPQIMEQLQGFESSDISYLIVELLFESAVCWFVLCLKLLHGFCHLQK